MNNNNLLQNMAAFALGAFGLLALVGVWFMYKTYYKTEVRTFNVQGTGEVMVVPTKGTITASFRQEGKTQKEANDLLAANLRKAYEEFDKLGIDKKDIKTDNVAQFPKYEYCYGYGDRIYWPEHCKVNPNDQKIIGYIYSQNISFKLEDKAKLESLLGILAGLKAKEINGPNWELSDEDRENAKNEARKKAVEEARRKAETITQALGQKLGKVVSYNENFGGYEPPIAYARAEIMMSKNQIDAGAPIPVSVGENKVTVNVDIVYEIR